MSYDVPILFMIFNRADTTERVFAEIRKLKPKRLFIAADGPRAHKEGEAERCMQTRDVVKDVDWECDVQHLYRDQNKGCKLAVSEAITWYFSQVEEGIILEDDCLPNPSFFRYAQDLLARYRDDDRVMMLSGQNTQHEIRRGPASYYFSRHAHIWGWATWRRAWDKYDVRIADLPQFKQQRQIANISDNPAVQEFWLRQFDMVHEGKLDTWDYQWVYTIMKHNGLVIMPNTNLISNIGFDERATHTPDADSAHANIPSHDVGELVHPEFILPSREADDYEVIHEFHIQPTPLVPRSDSLYRKVVKRVPQAWKDKVKRFVGR